MPECELSKNGLKISGVEPKFDKDGSVVRGLNRKLGDFLFLLQIWVKHLVFLSLNAHENNRTSVLHKGVTLINTFKIMRCSALC